MALLPFAVDGPDGWWPESPSASAGMSAGVIAVGFVGASALLLGVRALLGTDAAPMEPAGRATSIRTASADSSSELEVPSAMADRTLVDHVVDRPGHPAPAVAPEPGVLRLLVHTSYGPVPGARVSATAGDDAGPQILRIKATVTGEEGRKLKISPAGLFVLKERVGGSPDEAVTAVTGMDGIAELRVLDGQTWSLHVEAPGLAARTLTVSGTAEALDEAIRLDAGARAIIERGSFPLDRSIYVRLWNHVHIGVHEAFLLAGIQEVELAGLNPGRYRVEALSAPGDRITHWSLSADVASDRIAPIDVSLARRADVRMEVDGASIDAPAHFINVHGPRGDNGSPVWSEFVPVRSDIVSAISLPEGAAVARVLSGDAEIGRVAFEVEAGRGEQTVVVPLTSRELRVRHGAVDDPDFKIGIARRTAASSSSEEWTHLGDPIAGASVSIYRGLTPGDYRVWVKGRAAFRRYDVSLGADPVEVDVGTSATARVMTRRGAGVRRGTSVGVETTPGRWELLHPDDGAIEFSHGTHRLRFALEGLGHVVRSIVVPETTQLEIVQDAAPSPVTIDCGAAWAGESVRIAPDANLAALPILDPLSLLLDANGVGSLQLRPGTYVIMVRFRRNATLNIGPEGGRSEVCFE